MNSTNFDFELFFNSTPDLVCIAGYDGYFKKINPAVSKVLEYSEEELFSRPINSFIHKDDQISTSQARKNLTRSKTLLNFENRYVTGSGEVVWLHWTSEPIEGKELIFAIAKNITYKKKVEIETTSLLEQLTISNNQLKQLLLRTSHDVRTPLSSLLTVFDLLDLSSVDDSETLELFEILKLSGESLKNSLNQVLDEIRENQQHKVKTEEIRYKEVLNGVLQSIVPLTSNSEAIIDSDFTEAESVNFNRAYLESIFLNMITNSIKYSRPGIPPKITIESKLTNGSHQLIFSDNGLGFDMEKNGKKIFKLHQTFHKHEDSKGVGLYLIHNHVTSLGGDIRVESTLNKGSRFILSFNK